VDNCRASDGNFLPGGILDGGLKAVAVSDSLNPVHTDVMRYVGAAVRPQGSFTTVGKVTAVVVFGTETPIAPVSAGIETRRFAAPVVSVRSAGKIAA